MSDIFERMDEDFPPERKEPADGWKQPCRLADHKWALEVEEGRASLVCLDPHPESFMEECDPQRGAPVCIDHYWERDDLTLDGQIPVAVEHIDDNMPSGPWGPAEYAFWIELKPLATPPEEDHQ